MASINHQIVGRRVLCGLLLLGLLLACTPAGANWPHSAVGNQAAARREFSRYAEALPGQVAISGLVLWGRQPVAGARVELRAGAWADQQASTVVSLAVANSDGWYELQVSLTEGDLGLVAHWPDGRASTAPVVPIHLAGRAQRLEANVYLAEPLAWLAPEDGVWVCATPVLRWHNSPQASRYQLWVSDAATSELVVELAITGLAHSEQALTLPPLKPGHRYAYDLLALDSDGYLIGRRTGELAVASRLECPPAGASAPRRGGNVRQIEASSPAGALPGRRAAAERGG